ncbi:hypothetical protein ml_73 [Mollivirus sibericum]|uniref:hypothetical protein n=1 Tax=Mollivirus sibericum TaxID=1678078 RepID=UPI0006B2DFB6|nr:hypothetical protein ml_73 [Mollivirus sibericum]ALD61875.1 hypothetical protein ml_73 [Mollivirus sibericum]
MALQVDETRLEQAWRGMSKWPKERFEEDRQCWTKMTSEYELHSSQGCKVVETCDGCGKGFCRHLAKYRCNSMPVCHWCDEHLQPILSNPRNKGLVEKYVPKWAHDLLF